MRGGKPGFYPADEGPPEWAGARTRLDLYDPFGFSAGCSDEAPRA